MPQSSHDPCSTPHFDPTCSAENFENPSVVHDVIHLTPVAPKNSPNPTHVTPDVSMHPVAFIGEVTPPTPPRLRSRTTSTASLESPGLASRRAAAGKLSNKALINLQQMRFDAPSGDSGLGVAPGPEGYECDNASPGPGMAFRLALGLEKESDEKPCEESASPSSTPSLSPSSSLSRTCTPPKVGRRFASRSPGLSPASPEGIKIPPSLRSSKLLDKLNLTTPPQFSSPLPPGKERTGFSASPPSPLVLRSSAFNLSQMGSLTPLTPLTPSHLPGAPSLPSSGFQWSSYSDPLSPNCPHPPLPSICNDRQQLSPSRAFFIPTPPSNEAKSRGFKRNLSTSSLADRKIGDPFFTP